MHRLKEHLEQLAPRSAEKITPQDYEGIELTEEERARAINRAKAEKYIAIKKAEYWEKITSQPVYKTYTSSELLMRVASSRTATGKKFIVDSENEKQIKLLCMYFSGDKRMIDHGIRQDKGLLLMGGLGVGKTHLMSFFHQNQVQSYSMVSCRAIENKWVNVNPSKEDTDVIGHYSLPMQVAINSDPFGHTQLGLCLDDLGTETIPSKRYGEEKNVLAEVLLSRYERLEHWYTHGTTNLTGEDIKSLYGDRILDRLTEMCNVITFQGQSRRKNELFSHQI